MAKYNTFLKIYNHYYAQYIGLCFGRVVGTCALYKTKPFSLTYSNISIFICPDHKVKRMSILFQIGQKNIVISNKVLELLDFS